MTKRVAGDDSLRAKVRSILREIGNGADIGDGQDVFATRVISWHCRLELICRLEDRFGIVVSQRDVFEGSLKSVDRIVALVAARQSS